MALDWLCSEAFAKEGQMCNWEDYSIIENVFLEAEKLRKKGFTG